MQLCALIHNDSQSMVGECRHHQPYIEPAAAPLNLPQKPIPVTNNFRTATNNFFVRQKSRSLVTGSTVLKTKIIQ